MAFRYASASSNLMVNDINGGKLSLGSYAMQFDGYGAVVQKVLPEYRSAHAVIDGNEMNAKLRENNIGIHSHLEIIAPEAAHVLYDDALDSPGLDVSKHTLEARTVES